MPHESAPGTASGERLNWLEEMAETTRAAAAEAAARRQRATSVFWWSTVLAAVVYQQFLDEELVLLSLFETAWCALVGASVAGVFLSGVYAVAGLDRVATSQRDIGVIGSVVALVASLMLWIWPAWLLGKAAALLAASQVSGDYRSLVVLFETF